MPARCYRSRSFWFGLAGLVMLLVGWGSRSVHFHLAWNSASYRTYAFSISRGAVSFPFLDQSAVAGTGLAPSPGWRFRRPLREGRWQPPRLLVAPLRWRDLSAGPVTGVRVYIAVWIIVSVYVVAWYGGMVWWLRRKHRLMTNPLNHP